MLKETEKKVLRQIVRDIEVERGMDSTENPDRLELCVLTEDEQIQLACFLIDTGQATKKDLLRWF